MRAILVCAVLISTSGFGLAPTLAQNKAAELETGAPGVITQGSGNVSVGGQAAARKGDTDDRGSALLEGSPNVMINGRPAVTLGDRTGCGGVTVGGSSNVFINGKPVARAGDLTTGCDNK
jgi:uncharacterized Zn-binding protein involved in type VI secretion